MASERQVRIVVAGAGSIGCYVGGCLALAGRDVTLLLRTSLAEMIAGQGLRISDLDGLDRTLIPAAVKLATEPAPAFAEADIILVTVKSGATAAMAELIAEHAPSGATVVSLQNGVGNVDVLLARLGGMARVVPGMVPFNVVQTHGDGQPARFHRATSGTIQIGAGVAGLRETLDVHGSRSPSIRTWSACCGASCCSTSTMRSMRSSGVPLATQLADRRWRLLLAAQIKEGLAVLKAAGIRPARIEGVPPGAVPRILRLPNWLFRRVAGRMLAIDPEARSSMWEDLERPAGDRDRLSAGRDPGAGRPRSASACR